jgi:hypothetical protein
MISLRLISVLAGLAAFHLSLVDSSPYVISDDRVRSLDISPVLGRGYSIMTNTYQSTCLLVTDTTIPSYNYNYNFYSMTSNTDDSSSGPGQMKFSFSYFWIFRRWRANWSSSSNSKVQTQTRSFAASMRIERYYSSVREEVSPLSDDALTLIDRQDYIGFFKACGPNYIRGIRRAQEVVAYFEFQSTSQSESDSYADSWSSSSSSFFGFTRSRVSGSYSEKNSFSDMQSSLSITIKGYGLGLNQEGSETLVAQSMEEYQQVMKTAFRIMTQNKDSFHIGMVYGMEVVPWVDNTAFQVASRIDQPLVVPLPRSLIPMSIKKDRSDKSTFNPSTSSRDDFTCRDPNAKMDKFGYCCDSTQLYDYAQSIYNSTSPELQACRPLRTLDKSIVKNNMASNGEFVARLDQSVRFKLNQLSTLERCVSAARSLPSSHNFHILKSQDSVKYDEAIEAKFTLAELKMAIDPTGDYKLVKHMGKELDEYMDMFYQPCLAALFGSNIGTNGDTEPIYFMAYPWHTHEECLHLSCFGNNMRWNRNLGGCEPGMISGTSAHAYNANEDSKCSYADEGGTDQVCKYDQTTLNDYHTDARSCWSSTSNMGSLSVAYLMSHFCMPDLNGDYIESQTERDTLNATLYNCL